MVWFSRAELAAVRARAGLVGLAVGAWVGRVAADAAEGVGCVGMVDLLRLHADVLAVADAGAEVAGLLGRLDEAVAAVVAVGPRRYSRRWCTAGGWVG